MYTLGAKSTDAVNMRPSECQRTYADTGLTVDSKVQIGRSIGSLDILPHLLVNSLASFCRVSVSGYVLRQL